jgi:hypothetical protein
MNCFRRVGLCPYIGSDRHLYFAQASTFASNVNAPFAKRIEAEHYEIVHRFNVLFLARHDAFHLENNITSECFHLAFANDRDFAGISRVPRRPVTNISPS